MAKQEFLFAVAPEHPLAKAPEPLMTQVLSRHRVVVLTDTSRELLARTAGIASGIDTLTVADHNLKIAAITAGLGVGHMPRKVAERYAAEGRLVVKALADPMPPVTRHIAWRTNHEGKAMAWFVRRLDSPEWRARFE
jgi:DNA-binding transcriptional LysR family regulator